MAHHCNFFVDETLHESHALVAAFELHSFGAAFLYQSQGVSTKIADARYWKGSDLKFRAVGTGKYTILVYGSGVNLVAVGKGTVKLAGMPDTPTGDGRYSLRRLVSCSRRSVGVRPAA